MRRVPTMLTARYATIAGSPSATAGPADSEYREAAPGSARRPDRSRSRIGAHEKREAHILGSYAVASREIGRRPGDSEDAVVAASREAPGPDRLGEKAFGLRVGAAEALHLRHREISIHPTTGRGETLTHSVSRGEDSVTHVSGTLAAVIPQALERDTRHTRKSMRSRSGPEGRPRYRSIWSGRHV